jgi:hypothetical protein
MKTFGYLREVSLSLMTCIMFFCLCSMLCYCQSNTTKETNKNSDQLKEKVASETIISVSDPFIGEWNI